MDSIKYDFLYGGAYSIKEYYMESGNPRQMRGASELLNECTDDVKKLLLGIGVNDEQIITAGATLSALIPHGRGEEVAKKAELIFREKCRTASAAFVSVPMDDEYMTVKKHAFAEYECRKAAKFTSWNFQNSEDDTLDLPSAISKAQARCPRCRIRTPIYYVSHRNGEEQYLCTSCAKREQKSDDRKFDLRKECGKRFDYDYKINTASDLSDSEGHIALLYADINNLGGQEDKKSFSEDKIFHEIVEKTIRDAVHFAIEQAMTAGNQLEGSKLRSKFEIIALGGDDVCLLLPGDVALLTAMSLMNEFDKNQLGLTISVAACVATDTTALTYMESIVEQSLKDAKQTARKYGQSAVNLSFFTRPSTLFPMRAKDMNEFADLLERTLSVSSTALRNISEARRELSFDEEFTLFFNYYLSRDVQIIKNSRSVLKQIHGRYSSKNPWPDFVTWRRQRLGGGKK